MPFILIPFKMIAGDVCSHCEIVSVYGICWQYNNNIESNQLNVILTTYDRRKTKMRNRFT